MTRTHARLRCGNPCLLLTAARTLGAQPAEPPSAPLVSWQASWVWLAGAKDRANVFCLARKTIDLTAAPARAILRVSANNFYVATLNNECGVDKKDPVTAVQMIYYRVLFGAAWLQRARGNEEAARPGPRRCRSTPGGERRARARS